MKLKRDPVRRCTKMNRMWNFILIIFSFLLPAVSYPSSLISSPSSVSYFPLSLSPHSRTPSSTKFHLHRHSLTQPYPSLQNPFLDTAFPGFKHAPKPSPTRPYTLCNPSGKLFGSRTDSIRPVISAMPR
ncbi:hypothetical protein M501DRAFT_327006 [Patellaria atrata CBS 101060]|uniref:Uncharacterized protein n=1 Tax=Patellaria atrata CBS 101060 TaxID=1346257 RepID=A0A9P4S3P5_9PEZI|nr:hypothetical protein M501DRAFT_327006 [Patellaria atrata CBS 101060]